MTVVNHVSHPRPGDPFFWHAAFFDLALELHLGVDRQGRILETNPAWLAALGYRLDDLLGTSYLSLVHPDDHERTNEWLAVLNDEQAVDELTNRIRAEDGTYRSIEWLARPLVEHGVIVVVGRDVTRYVNSLEELRQARDEAREASSAKSTFLSRMSHELRTPLNSILGFAQLLSMDSLPDAHREYVGFIERSGNHLLKLINEVLDIAQIETGRMRISLEPVSVADELQTALDLIRPQAADRGITLPTASVAAGLYVMADRQRLLQVLLNLLSNAVKYNRPQGLITINCEESGGTVSIAVTDTGIGMNAAQLALIFVPFERLGAESSSVEGTGMGMPLSRTLTQQMGGTLTVSSNVGAGSTFCLELPAAELPDHPEGPTSEPVASEAVEPDLHVLYIEDNIANSVLMERALLARGHVALTTAIQGSLGYDLAVRTHPDLILLDLHLPDTPGEEILQRLRANPATASTKIVVCSADASPRQVSQVKAFGADGYLTKPIHLPDLFELIDELTAETRTPDQAVATDPPG